MQRFSDFLNTGERFIQPVSVFLLILVIDTMAMTDIHRSHQALLALHYLYHKFQKAG